MIYYCCFPDVIVVFAVVVRNIKFENLRICAIVHVYVYTTVIEASKFDF